MSARLIQKGNIIDYTPSGVNITAGDVVVAGTFVGVAQNDIADGTLGSVAITGVWEVPKGTATFTQGAAVYWNATNGYATATDTDTYMGRAWAANSSSSAGTLLVRLEPGGNAGYANP